MGVKAGAGAKAAVDAEAKAGGSAAEVDAKAAAGPAVVAKKP